MALKLKKMVGMQEAKTRFSVQNDATVGTYSKPKGGASRKHAQLAASHAPTNADAADMAMTKTHMDAMAAPKRKSQNTRQMPSHGGRTSTMGKY